MCLNDDGWKRRKLRITTKLEKRRLEGFRETETDFTKNDLKRIKNKKTTTSKNEKRMLDSFRTAKEIVKSDLEDFRRTKGDSNRM